LWWAAPAGSEAGWALHIAHQGDVVVATWSTYDLNGKAWWLELVAVKGAGNTYSGTFYETRGPPFNSVPFDSTKVTNMAVGTGTLTFTDSSSGSFSYSLNGITRPKPITLFTFANPVPVCTFGSAIAPAQATNYQGIWWGAPFESGWSLALIHQDNVIVADWFTYDGTGSPIWLSAALFPVSAGTYFGELIQTTGPPWSAVPFDPRNVSLTRLGTVSLSFSNGNTGLFSYAIGNVLQSKAITRFVFVAPGTLCQ
jgi:hypothetical protein